MKENNDSFFGGVGVVLQQLLFMTVAFIGTFPFIGPVIALALLTLLRPFYRSIETFYDVTKWSFNMGCMTSVASFILLSNMPAA